MSEWVVVRDIPYEGTYEFHGSAQECVAYIEGLSPLDRDDLEGVRPATRSYDSWDFIEKVRTGQLV